MKKICLLIPSMKYGGAERAASRISIMLNNDFEVSIVVFDDENITYTSSKKPLSLNAPSTSNNIIRKMINSLRRIIKYRNYKKENNIDITYSFGSSANIVNVLTFGNDKKIISFRGYKGLCLENSFSNKYLFRPIIRMQAFLSDAIVMVSEKMKHDFIKKYGYENKTKVIYNGYDLEEIGAKAQLRNEVNQDFMRIKNSGDKIIISVGNYREEKGYWHLLKIFSQVHKLRQDVSLVILGRGSDREREKIIKLANELLIAHKVFLLGYDANVFKYYVQSDVYVLSSVSEGFPNALVEAMACGLPIVANNCTTGPSEILEGGLNRENDTSLHKYGILTPKLNKIPDWSAKVIESEEKIMATMILDLLEDTRLKEKYSKLSIKRAEYFSFKLWKESHEKLISNILAE